MKTRIDTESYHTRVLNVLIRIHSRFTKDTITDLYNEYRSKNYEHPHKMVAKELDRIMIRNRKTIENNRLKHNLFKRNQ